MSFKNPNGVPAYLLHKASGHARVFINRNEIRLGKYDSPESREKYDRIIAEWLAAGRQLPQTYRGPKDRTVSEIIVAFMGHAEVEYFKDERPTKEYKNLKPPLRILQRLYGTFPAAAFGPMELNAVREALLSQHVLPQKAEDPAVGENGPPHRRVKARLSRRYVNQAIDRIRRMFRWAASRRLVSPTVVQGLNTLAGLRRGKGGVERPKIKIVPDSFVQAVKPHVSRQVWGLIELQLATGMRPGEAIALRGADLTTSCTLWEINPTEHKTAHFGIDRTILVGPKAQEIIKPFLKSDLSAYLFCPKEAQAERYETLRAARKTKVQPSQKNRKKSAPKRAPATHYSCDSYRRAIHRACDLADDQARAAALKAGKELKEGERLIPRWSPNRLRHNFATWMRREYGIETARILLGHTSASTTEIYAEADRVKARQVIEAAG